MRVVIAEDEALVRRGLELVLREGGHEVLAAVADPRALLHSVETLVPDLVITDIRMPPTHTEEGILPPSASGGSIRPSQSSSSRSMCSVATRGTCSDRAPPLGTSVTC